MTCKEPIDPEDVLSTFSQVEDVQLYYIHLFVSLKLLLCNTRLTCNKSVANLN